MSLSSFCASLVPTSEAAPAVPPQGSALAGPTFMLVAVYAIPIIVALRPVADPDIWWHLRAGQWICEHQALPVTDPFSSWGADKPWIAYSWLFEVLVYRLYETWGLTGIVLYRLALSLAVVAALHRLIQRRQPRFAPLLTAAAALAFAPLLNERSWLFTILFATLTLGVLLDLRDGRAGRGIWLLPFVYVLWANLHIQFIYGLFLLALACLPYPCWRCGLAKRGVLAGLCLLATLVNPYHIRLYGVVVELATQSGPLRYISEMHAMEFRGAADWMVLLFGAAAAFTLGRRPRLSSFEVLLLVSAGFFAFRSQRDLWFLVLAAAAILAGQPAPFPERFQTAPPCRAAAAGVLIALIGLLAWCRGLSEENLQRKVGEVFPVEAAALIAEHGYPGPLFNDYDWGGFLIWTLPQLPVVLDGRANLHGDERIIRFLNTWSAGPGWHDDPDLESAGVVLANVHDALGCVLILDDRFQLVHEDSVARVFVRKRSPHRDETSSLRSGQADSRMKHGCGT
ncbi:MAG TPA: hypothetical protein VFA18_21250 [Gemmataceae bacterium]|nr:hypothetical protein [Gemmataceae bacterium]